LLTVADAMPHLPHGKNPLAVGVKSYQLPDPAKKGSSKPRPDHYEPEKPSDLAPHAGVAAG